MPHSASEIPSLLANLRKQEDRSTASSQRSFALIRDVMLFRGGLISAHVLSFLPLVFLNPDLSHAGGITVKVPTVLRSCRGDRALESSLIFWRMNNAWPDAVRSGISPSQYSTQSQICWAGERLPNAGCYCHYLSGRVQIVCTNPPGDDWLYVRGPDGYSIADLCSETCSCTEDLGSIPIRGLRIPRDQLHWQKTSLRRENKPNEKASRGRGRSAGAKHFIDQMQIPQTRLAVICGNTGNCDISKMPISEVNKPLSAPTTPLFEGYSETPPIMGKDYILQSDPASLSKRVDDPGYIGGYEPPFSDVIWCEGDKSMGNNEWLRPDYWPDPIISGIFPVQYVSQVDVCYVGSSLPNAGCACMKMSRDGHRVVCTTPPGNSELHMPGSSGVSVVDWCERTCFCGDRDESPMARNEKALEAARKSAEKLKDISRQAQAKQFLAKSSLFSRFSKTRTRKGNEYACTSSMSCPEGMVCKTDVHDSAYENISPLPLFDQFSCVVMSAGRSALGQGLDSCSLCGRDELVLDSTACACNVTYVSRACCDSNDGIIWEAVERKLGQVRLAPRYVP